MNVVVNCKVLKKIIFLSVFGICLTGCFSPPFPGFKEIRSGLFYKLHSIGDGNYKAQKGDYVNLLISGHFPGSKIFFNEFKDTTLQISGFEKGTIDEYISFLMEGDSALFIEDSLKTAVKIKKILTYQQYKKEQEYLSWKNDQEMNELKKLKDLLNRKKIDNSYLTDGIFFIPIKKGKGNIVETGNTVVVHYKGSFPDSTVFDDTYAKKEPFEFKFGDEGQVLRGIELAICQMRKGEKAKIIIPSQLAFGESGSSTGIVPPFTTVEYELEIVNLK